MEIKGHTVRVDDDVWEKLNALPGKSMNEGLRTLLVDGRPAADTAVQETLELVRSLPNIEDVEQAVDSTMRRIIGERKAEAPATDEAPAAAPFHPMCRHCGNEFGAFNRHASLCPNCKATRHVGDPRECSECTTGSSI